jgi:hypothetical protein
VPDVNSGQHVNANMEIDGQVEDVDEDEDDPWPEWNPANPVVPVVQQPPHHPAFPQYFIDLDLSSSLMRFLRATGPDISLDEVLQGSGSNGSSTSSDASSTPDENQACFLAVQNLCATLTIFHRMGLPSLCSALPAQRSSPVILMNPILIDTETRDLPGLEIIP